MVINLTVTGADAIARKLRVLGDDMPAAAGRALYRFAESEIARPAKEQYVPVMIGNLRASIVTEQPVVTRTSARVVVGAGGSAVPYARKVHENPRSGRTGGFSPSGRPYKEWSRVGQWKYLETPAIEAVNTRLDVFAHECGVELDEVIRGIR